MVNLASSGTDEAAGSSLPRDGAPANYFRDPSKAMVNLSSSMPSTAIAGDDAPHHRMRMPTWRRPVAGGDANQTGDPVIAADDAQLLSRLAPPEAGHVPRDLGLRLRPTDASFECRAAAAVAGRRGHSRRARGSGEADSRTFTAVPFPPNSARRWPSCRWLRARGFTIEARAIRRPIASHPSPRSAAGSAWLGASLVRAGWVAADF